MMTSCFEPQIGLGHAQLVARLWEFKRLKHRPVMKPGDRRPTSGRWQLGLNRQAEVKECHGLNCLQTHTMARIAEQST